MRIMCSNQDGVKNKMILQKAKALRTIGHGKEEQRPQSSQTVVPRIRLHKGN